MPENLLTKSELGVNKRPNRAKFDPIISTLGVKLALNIVNIPKPTPIFPVQAWFGLYLDKKAIWGVKMVR